MPEDDAERIARELSEARDELAAAERRAMKPRIRYNVWDLNELPRVDLGEVLAAYDPVSVGTEAGNEYIVVAPRGSVYERPGNQQLAELHRPRGLPKEDGPLRTGIGTTTGAVVPHPRVDYNNLQGIGVGDVTDELTTELGTSVASPWTAWTRQEYNSDLIGYKGLRVYDKMWKSDGTVRGTLRLAMTPVLSAMWGMKPASDSARDKKIADFVWKNLTLWMSTSWPQFLTEALLMLKYGYYMFEKVYARGEDVTADPDARGKIVWKKFAPRHPMDVKEWYIDINGGPLSVDMWAPPVQAADLSLTQQGIGMRGMRLQQGGTPVAGIPSTFQGGVIQDWERWINIPIDKLLVFSFDKEAGNIEGVSILRSAYKHWYYKDNLYKIDAIQKERHGIGIPVITLPVGYSPSDKQNADNLGRNLRTNDRAHVVLPPNWLLEFAELKGHPVDCLPSIKHHDSMIPQTILGEFMVSQKTDIEEQHTIFLKATRFTADIVLDVINCFAIPQLVNFNWGRSVYPRLYAKRIGEQEDWRTQSFTIRNYVGAGVIVPDDALENQLRDEMGLPPVDPSTARVVREPATMNPQRIQPAPTEEPGGGHVYLPAGMPGQPATPYMTQQLNPQGRPERASGRGTSPATHRGPTPQLPSKIAVPSGAGKPGLPRVGPPRQSKPGIVRPSTGRGDRSGKSGRRGQ